LVITAIIGSIAARLVPVIANIVIAALAIPQELAEGNINAVDQFSVQLCQYLQDLSNVLAMLSPVKFILEILELFLGLGAQFPCVSSEDSPCCTSENCPPILINPPAGRMKVLNRVEKFTLADLVNFILGFINPILEIISDFLNLVLQPVFDVINAVLSGIDVVLSAITGAVGDLFDTVNDLTFGAFPSASDLGIGSVDLESLVVDDLNIDLTLDIPASFEEVVFIQPLMTLEYLSATSQENENGLISAKGVGASFTAEELGNLQNFIIPPDVLPVPLPSLPSFLAGEGSDEDPEDPATIKVRLKTIPASSAAVSNPINAESKKITGPVFKLNFSPIVGTQGTTVGGVGQSDPSLLSVDEVAVRFTTVNGDPHPVFLNETLFQEDAFPTQFGSFAIDYENGLIKIPEEAFAGNSQHVENTLTPEQVRIYQQNLDVVVRYNYQTFLGVVEKIVSALFEFPTIEQILASLGLPNTAQGADELRNLFSFLGFGFIPLDALGIIQVFDDTFEADTILEYEILPQQIELLKNNLIGLGCQNDIQSAAQALVTCINADTDAAAATGGDGNDAPGSGEDQGFSALDPLNKKIGREFPAPPIDDLQECFNLIAEDPTNDVTQQCLDIVNDYLVDLADFADAVLCVGASSLQSIFTVSKPFVLTDGKDRAIISLIIKDAGGNDLLTGGLLPDSDFQVQFFTTFGQIGPVEFDPDTGAFTAAITSAQIGTADITASLVVRGKTCTRISIFDDFQVTNQILQVEFVPERTQFPRIRRKQQYVQSRGGRARR
jgi:hypothetical protein